MRHNVTLRRLLKSEYGHIKICFMGLKFYCSSLVVWGYLSGLVTSLFSGGIKTL